MGQHEANIGCCKQKEGAGRVQWAKGAADNLLWALQVTSRHHHGPCISEESATDPTTSPTKNLRSPSQQNSPHSDACPPLRLTITLSSV